MCINQNELTAAIDQIIAESNRIQTCIQTGVQQYLEIQRQYDSMNPLGEDFLDCFSDFYVLTPQMTNVNRANLLKLINSRTLVSIEEAIRSLIVPNDPAVNFSFATKALHTIDTSRPIYDLHVGHFFRLEQERNIENFEERIQQRVGLYNSLCAFFMDRNGNGLIRLAAAFDTIYPSIGNQISEVKKIDFMIWGFGRLF